MRLRSSIGIYILYSFSNGATEERLAIFPTSHKRMLVLLQRWALRNDCGDVVTQRIW